MSGSETDEAAERERLIFGAGFAFGVMFTLLILGMVFSTLVSETVELSSLFDSQVLVPVSAAIMFAFVTGVGLYLLALPAGDFGIPKPIIDPDPPESEADTDK